MNLYAIYTTDGTATLVAHSLRNAWEQAVQLFTEVVDITFVQHLT